MITVKKERRVLADGTAALLVYEAESDELNVYFGENRRATGVQLADHILLRLDRAEGKAISLSFIGFWRSFIGSFNSYPIFAAYRRGRC